MVKGGGWGKNVWKKKGDELLERGVEGKTSGGDNC